MVKFSTTKYDKRDDFNFSIINFPHLNMLTAPAYGVYISQLMRDAIACCYNVTIFRVLNY